MENTDGRKSESCPNIETSMKQFCLLDFVTQDKIERIKSSDRNSLDQSTNAGETLESTVNRLSIQNNGVVPTYLELVGDSKVTIRLPLDSWRRIAGMN